MTELDIALRAVQLYAETHPRPPHVTQSQAARMLNVSAPTVHKWIKQGRMRLNNAGQIPMSEIDRLIAQSAPHTGRRAA